MLDVIITGAGGFIGRALRKRLTDDGLHVLALNHSDGNVADPAFWSRLPAARALIHLAARSYVPDSWKAPADFLETNVVGTQYALEWCCRHQARMVFASAYLYGIPVRLPINETDRVSPNNPYALSKHLAEQCCEFASRNDGLDVTILRVFNVFGRGQRDEFLLPTLIQQLDEQEVRVMDISPRRDYVYLPDVVDAFFRALQGPQGFHVFNIGSGKSYSVAEIVETLLSIAGKRLPIISTAEPRRQEIPDVRADIDLAGRELGWKPAFDLAAGLKDMLEGSGS